MLNFVEIGVVNRHVRKQLAVVGVIRGFRIPAVFQHLLDTHTVVVVLEGQGLSVAGHFPKLSADCPFIRPASIVQRVTDCVISNGSAIVCGQLILPVGIAVGIRNGFQRCADRAGSIRILRLAENISATIIAVDPRRILMRIIDSDQLSQCIIGVGGGQISALFRCNIAQIIIRILERDSVLGNLLYKRRGTIRTVRAPSTYS